MLNDSPAEILWQLLVDHGIGTDGGDWPVFVSAEPDLPDNCITVYDTAWKEDGRAMADGTSFHHYGVQVRVRAVDHRTGFLKAVQIHEHLDTKVNMEAVVTASRSYVVEAASGSNVLSVGQDTPKTKRQVFTLNPLLAIQEA